MKFPESVLVTDHKIDLALSPAQKDHFIRLADAIAVRYASSGKNRMAVSLSAPSGAGKSVTAAILQALFADCDVFSFYYVDLDAYHFKNAYLESTIDRAGTVLRTVKGRYDTYDTDKLVQHLVAFRRGDAVMFPHYSRQWHEPVDAGLHADATRAVLFLPGLWFQRNDACWEKVRTFLDFTIAIHGKEERFKPNTIGRHVKGGRTKEDAEKFYTESDSVNTYEIYTNSIPADLPIRYYEDIVP